METVVTILFLVFVLYVVGKRPDYAKSKGFTAKEPEKPREHIKGIKPKHWVDTSTKRAEWVKPIKRDVINYEEYIKSIDWLTNSARIQVLFDDNNSCRMCGSKDNLHVHHLHYRTLGKESAEDLAVLCEICHNYTHKVAGKGAGDYPALQCPSTK